MKVAYTCQWLIKKLYRKLLLEICKYFCKKSQTLTDFSKITVYLKDIYAFFSVFCLVKTFGNFCICIQFYLYSFSKTVLKWEKMKNKICFTPEQFFFSIFLAIIFLIKVFFFVVVALALCFLLLSAAHKSEHLVFLNLFLNL